MPKEIKKLFDFMNLEYNSSVEDIKSRQRVLIKVLRAKGIKRGKSYAEKIDKVNSATNQILAYISVHDNSNEPIPFYRTTTYDLSTLGFSLLIAIIICAGTFLAML